MAHGFIESDRNGRRVIGHGGDTLWFHTALELYPDQGIGIFASFNTADAEPQKLTKAFADRYFAPAEWTPQLAAADWTDRARRFAGAYRSVRYSHHDLTKLGALASQLDGERRRRRRAASCPRSRARAGSRSSRWSSATRMEPRPSPSARAGAAASRYLFVGEVPVFAFERVPWHESLEVPRRDRGRRDRSCSPPPS